MPEPDSVPTKKVTDPEIRPPSSGGDAPARLVIFQGIEQGRIVELGTGTVSQGTLHVGRAEGNDLVLPSDKVSKQHLQISWDHDKAAGVVYRVEDLDSTNGVAVNGRRLQAGEKRILRHGDTVRASDHVLLFYHPRRASERNILESIKLDPKKIDAEVQAALAKLADVKNVVLRRRETGRAGGLAAD